MTNISRQEENSCRLLGAFLAPGAPQAAHQGTGRAHPQSCKDVEVCNGVPGGNTFWDTQV